MKTALISVSDKTNLVDFAKKLALLGVEIISTGGTYKILTENNINAIEASEVTQFPECLDGRVKTMHPKILGGILYLRDNEEHIETIEKLGMKHIDIVIVNLYPFLETIKKEDHTFDMAMENIDIGGPSMIRAAAKNHKYVSVVTDPKDYDELLSELEKNQKPSEEFNKKLAAKAFAHTAFYDSLIFEYFNSQIKEQEFYEEYTKPFIKKHPLRYGENPHQKAAYYVDPLMDDGTISSAKCIQGKELSYNNINDSNAAVELIKEFNGAIACAALKHASPCGVAIGESSYEAFMKAYKADPISIFGGIVAFNSEVDEKTAKELNKIFLEVIIAPSYTKEAVEILNLKKNVRVLVIPNIKKINKGLEMKKVGGGLLVQELDRSFTESSEYKYMTTSIPNESQIKDLDFALKTVKHVKSNAIVIAKDGQTLGIGGGQVSRVWAAESAILRSGNEANGAVMASDGFLPFDDVAKMAKAFGIKAIIEPGGSMNDKDTIKVCEECGIALVFTNMRHFKH